MDQYIGKLLDNRYEIIERIGSGGMAVVYKALCHRLNRMVAIKILKTELAQDAEIRRRFRDESQAVAMLSHPNIVAVYDVSHSEDLDYIVMELIDGITLKQYMCKKGAPLNWREALHFITQIVRGLSHAHSRGIIHRDIKPHNVMVLRDGSVKVADFGIARFTSAVHNTLTQEALGSVHYISPEQAKGSHIDARSDLYSAGVVLYEMITGRLPYEGDSPISVAIQHINSVPLAPREINPDIPEALEAITMKAMAANVEQRYVSADAMLEDLEEFRKNPNINFDYTMADLKGGVDEPTRVSGAVAVPYGGEQVRRTEQEATPARRAAGGEQAGRRTEQERRRQVERKRASRDDYDDDGRGRGSILPTLLAVATILIFLAVIGYFLWISFIEPLLNPTVIQYKTPDLVGQMYEDVAGDAAMLSGFSVEKYKTVYRDDVPEGQIVEQDPQGGEMVYAGNRNIRLTVCGGSSHFVMDDYTNQSAAHVKALLTDRGFKVTTEVEISETVTKDFIISQRPAEGTLLQEGASITLIISAGPSPKMVTMVPFEGWTLEKASEEIAKMNLTLGEIERVYDDTWPDGVVVWQSIDPTVEVPERKTVDLKVSKGPDPNRPPEVPTEEPTDSPEPSPTESEQPPEPTESGSPSPSPSTDPSPEPTPEEPSPSPGTAPVQIEIALPTDRETVELRITVAGEEQYYAPALDTSFRFIRPTLWGRGQVIRVCIYMDGELTETRYLNFTDD